ncbi:MAG: hypothetical protein Q9168_004224 [Polycauliona sp. 1 TL-2023]
MDSIRNAMGYGAQSGQEPLSGQTGQGTVDQPYDSGNIAGQSGAPSSYATSTNPSGTTQFDTGTDHKGETIGYGSGDITSTSQYTTGDNSSTSQYPTGDNSSTSQYPTGDNTSTSQYPTGDNSSTSQYPTGDGSTHASENLAAGLSSDSHGKHSPFYSDLRFKVSNEANADTFIVGPVDSPSVHEPAGKSIAGDTSGAAAGDTAGAAEKGTDETRGPDEEVASEHRPTTDNNHNAQDTFFKNAGLSKDNPADPPKAASEVADKDPFASSGGATSNETTNDSSSQPVASESSNTTSGAVGDTDLNKVSSTAPDKNYISANTEPYTQSSEVLSSATPGAALDSQPQSQTSGYDNSTPSAAATGAGGFGNDDNNYSTTPSTADKGMSLNENTTGSNNDHIPFDTNTSTTAAAADTDYPSPRTQPSESAGGLAGVSHNTGSAPSAPDTGVSDSSLQQAADQGASDVGQGGEGGKKKMSEKIKEKLHMGKK